MTKNNVVTGFIIGLLVGVISDVISAKTGVTV